jgi:hypothetical protein
MTNRLTVRVHGRFAQCPRVSAKNPFKGYDSFCISTLYKSHHARRAAGLFGGEDDE